MEAVMLLLARPLLSRRLVDFSPYFVLIFDLVRLTLAVGKLWVMVATARSPTLTVSWPLSQQSG